MYKPTVQILYNNKDITTDISKYIASVTYTDYEENESDELSVVLNDYDKLFQKDWYPQKGDKLSAKIGYQNHKLLDCGTFTIDEPELAINTDGDTFTIRALAASINQKTREKQNKSHTDTTLIDIARKIGEKHGYTVAGSAGFVKIPYEVQYNESDLAFLRRLSASYGYIFKLCDTVISFVPVEDLEKSEIIDTLLRKDIKSANLRDCGTKYYKACTAKYLNPKTGKLVSYTAKNNDSEDKLDTLKLNEKYSTKEAAMLAAKAGLKRGSKTIEGRLEFVRGNCYAIAGVNFNLALDTAYDGRYHVIQSTHTVTRENYETNVEVRKIA